MIRRTTTAPWRTTGRSMALFSPMMATSGRVDDGRRGDAAEFAEDWSR